MNESCLPCHFLKVHFEPFVSVKNLNDIWRNSIQFIRGLSTIFHPQWMLISTSLHLILPCCERTKVARGLLIVTYDRCTCGNLTRFFRWSRAKNTLYFWLPSFTFDMELFRDFHIIENPDSSPPPSPLQNWTKLKSYNVKEPLFNVF